MADLNFTQSADPVAIFNDQSGNQLLVNADGSTNARLYDGAGSSVPKGQAVMASSLPVAIASNQSAIPVTTEGAKSSYSAAFVGLVPPAAATDIFTITGSASKVVRITAVRFSISTTAGSGILANVNLVVRSSANSAGTSSTVTAVPHDSTNAAATAVVRGYTANPTLGTAVGAIRATRYAATPASVPNQEADFDFGTRPAQTIVLRGTAGQLCVNLGGATITGPVVDVSIEWTEE